MGKESVTQVQEAQRVPRRKMLKMLLFTVLSSPHASYYAETHSNQIDKN